MGLLDMLYTGGPTKKDPRAVPASELDKNKAPTVSKFDNPAPASAMPTYYPVPTTVPTYSVAPTGQSPAYDKMLEVTNLENTAAYKQIYNFMVNLKAIIPDPTTQFRAAFAQAAATGLTKDKFLSAFRDLRNALDGIKAGFTQFEAEQNALVASKEAQISQLGKEVESYQQRIAQSVASQTQLRNEVTAIHAKVDTARADVETAYSRRKAEIDQDEARYTPLLG